MCLTNSHHQYLGALVYDRQVAGPKHTFAVNLLAHTCCPPIFDRSVTTIDVEKGVLNSPDSTTKQKDATQSATHSRSGGHAARETPARSTARSSDLLDPVQVVLHWVRSVVHLGGVVVACLRYAMDGQAARE